MTRNVFLILSLNLSVALSLSAQVQTNEAADKNQLSYQNVFDNMHYNQGFRPQVHYTPITGQIADATGLILYKGEYHLNFCFKQEE